MLHTNFSSLYSEEVLSDSDSVLFICEKLNNGAGDGSVDGNINLDQGASAQLEGESRWNTLSVSMVAISSSASTVSPTCFDHDFKVPSEIDSAI